MSRGTVPYLETQGSPDMVPYLETQCLGVRFRTWRFRVSGYDIVSGDTSYWEMKAE